MIFIFGLGHFILQLTNKISLLAMLLVHNITNLGDFTKDNIIFLEENVSSNAIALCVIFTILVSFSRNNALFASKAKFHVFEIFSKGERPQRGQRSENFFSKNIDFSL